MESKKHKNHINSFMSESIIEHLIGPHYEINQEFL
jgi:hypothetical protein